MSSVCKKVFGDSTKATCQFSQFEHIPKKQFGNLNPAGEKSVYEHSYKRAKQCLSTKFITLKLFLC